MTIDHLQIEKTISNSNKKININSDENKMNPSENTESNTHSDKSKSNQNSNTKNISISWAPQFNFHHFQLGKPDQFWPYFNKNSQLIGYIARWNTKCGKEIRPVCFIDGKWECRGFEKPYPLYNLPEILKNKEKTVLIVEGEKSADSAKDLFPDLITTTSIYGAMSINSTNWDFLKERDVIICPDLDDAGEIFLKKVKEKLEEVGVKTVKLLNLEKIQEKLNAKNIKGFDIADAKDLNWRPEKIENLIEEFPFNPEEVLPKGFFIKENKIYYEYTFKKQEIDYTEDRFLCSYLVVKSRKRDEAGQNWGYLIEITDPDFKKKELAIPAKLFAGDGLELRELLLDSGVTIAPSSNKILMQYLITSKPKKHIRCTCQTG